MRLASVPAFTGRTKKEATSRLGDTVSTGIIDEQIVHVGSSGCPRPPKRPSRAGSRASKKSAHFLRCNAVNELARIPQLK